MRVFFSTTFVFLISISPGSFLPLLISRSFDTFFFSIFKCMFSNGLCDKSHNIIFLKSNLLASCFNNFTFLVFIHFEILITIPRLFSSVKALQDKKTYSCRKKSLLSYALMAFLPKVA